MSFMFRFSRLVDQAKAFGAKVARQRLYSLVGGRMLNLQVDSVAKRISLALGPKGEDGTIGVEVGNYVLTEQGGVTTLRIGSAKSDRPVYHVALQAFVAGKSFVVPQEFAEWVKLIL